MSDNFQQTVDLREQMEKKRMSGNAPKSAAPLEKIYEPGDDGVKKNLKKISRPVIKTMPEGLVRLVVIILAILAVGLTVYFMFFRSTGAEQAVKSENWYAVKLVDGEIFYGQIADTKTDPVVMSNVYYNYDQAKLTTGDKEVSKSIEETGNIRLVKRGNETHGPAGTMDIVRAQVLFMEPLKNDSKVLKAILEYEK